MTIRHRAGKAEEGRVRNSLLDKRIKSAVNDAMAAKGLEQFESNPGFLVTYHVGVQDKVDVTDWGYSYHPYDYYGGWAGRDIQVTQYQEGTLVLDFIDTEGMNLAWRGIAQKVLEAAPLSGKGAKEPRQHRPEVAGAVPTQVEKTGSGTEL